MGRQLFRMGRRSTLFVEPTIIIGLIIFIIVGFALREQQPSNLIVMLGDPEGKTGVVEVITNAGSQTLTEPGSATGVSGAGEAPREPFDVSQREIVSLFGDAIKARPTLPKSFTLYFRPNSSILTDEAKSDVGKIAQEIRRRKVSDISIYGHADRTGSREINVRISLRRANVVRDALFAVGLDTSKITIDSFGDSDPLVPTPAGVAEPRNRRVEVIVR